MYSEHCEHFERSYIIQGYAVIYVTHIVNIVQCADIIHRGKKFGQIRAGGC